MEKYLKNIFCLAICLASLQSQAQPRKCISGEGLEFSPQNQVTTTLENITSRSEVCLPVIVHIVYENDVNNLSDLQVYSQIDALNRDFNLRNENLWKVPAEFRSVIANVGIRFCLASEDPDGKATSGITRVKTSFQHIGTATGEEGRRRIKYSAQGGSDAWDPTRYINVWVGRMEGLAGFATFPEQAPFPAEDGIIIHTDFFGSIGSKDPDNDLDRGHTLTHEMGHYLNLIHIWGNSNQSCEEDDLVSDTPLQFEPNLNCPAHPALSCGSPDMFMNFMDFSNDGCLAMFTEGQKARMLAALANERNGILESTVQCHQWLKPPANEVLETLRVFHLNLEERIIIENLQATEGNIDVDIFDFTGRLVASSQLLNEYSQIIFTDGWSSGGYIILLRHNGNEKAVKVMKY